MFGSGSRVVAGCMVTEGAVRKEALAVVRIPPFLTSLRITAHARDVLTMAASMLVPFVCLHCMLLVGSAEWNLHSIALQDVACSSPCCKKHTLYTGCIKWRLGPLPLYGSATV